MLYIMRHGKTDWNERKKLQGRTDIPLNEEGMAMAKAAADEYKDIHFDVCYCSPLKRAQQTAGLVLEGRNIPIITDDRLVEMSFGEYEGIENSFAIPDCPINVFFRNPEKYTTPVEGAESMDEMFKRTGEFLSQVVYPDLEQGKDILIVGHGAMNSSIVCQVKNLPLEKFWSEGIKNCKLMRLL
ncbi:MAG: histidine phosphatase family protein [Lachnospira sp.]